MSTNEILNSSIPKLALSRTEAAQALGVSPVTIDRLAKRGLLRPSRAIRRPLYTVAELERFLRETDDFTWMEDKTISPTSPRVRRKRRGEIPNTNKGTTDEVTGASLPQTNRHIA